VRVRDNPAIPTKISLMKISLMPDPSWRQFAKENVTTFSRSWRHSGCGPMPRAQTAYLVARSLCGRPRAGFGRIAQAMGMQGRSPQTRIGHEGPRGSGLLRSFRPGH
jgi:hypothetical protein